MNLTKPNEQTAEITVSVIIPCYNGKATVRNTLKALAGQETDFSFETIVVDSSNDGTDQLIRTEFPSVRLIRLEKQTLPGSGRNLGVEQACGEIVAFTDADAVPDSDWLQRIVVLHRTRETDGVGGCVVNGYPHSPTAWVSHLIEFNEWTESTPAGFEKNNPSVNVSYKRSVFKKYRICFSDVFPSEDTLFNWSLIERGGKIYYDPEVRVVHLSRVGFLKLFQHQVRLGRASARARIISTLPGRIFITYPVLCLALPAIRWIRASLRLMVRDPLLLLLFWLLTPLYLGATIAWTVGFVQRRDFKEPDYIIEGCDFDVFGQKE